MTSTSTLKCLLADELDEAASALTLFDVERLEAVEARICAMTAAHLASGRVRLPELLDKHALLGQLLAMTAANLKVLGSILNLNTLNLAMRTATRSDAALERR